MEQWDDYKLDTRNREEIEEEIKRLARAYTPEWNFDSQNPDAGSVLAMIFAGQMAENIRLYNQVLDRYHADFAGLFRIPPRPARPAHSVAVVQVSPDAQDGIPIKTGRKFLAEAGEEQITFTACHDIQALPGELRRILLVSGKEEKYIPLKGNWEQPALLGEIKPLPGGTGKHSAFDLFDSRGPGIRRNALVLYHSFGLDTEGDVLCLRVQGTYDRTEFARRLCDRENYRFLYYAAGQIQPVEEVWQEGDQICLKRYQKDEKAAVGKENYTALILERMTPVQEEIQLEKLELFSQKGSREPDFIWGQDQELPKDHAAVFGQELAVYQECCLGQDQVFGKKGAEITLSFQVSFEENMRYASLPEEEDLPVIKRRERKLRRETAAEVAVQEVSLCYYNGTGWKKLPCETDMPHMFDRTCGEGIRKIRFLCPLDWEPVTIGGYEQRCLRFQITRADNCYFLPARHWYPVLSKVTFSYEYKEHTLSPQRLEQRFGMECRDLIPQMRALGSVPVFPKFSWEGESLLLGLDSIPKKGPVSLYFVLESHVNFPGFHLDFEYGTRQGFRKLKAADYTQGFQKTGTILFLPPEDMGKTRVAGQECCWIKITAKNLTAKQTYFPRVRQIYLNGVEVWNVQAQEEEEYYLERPEADMSFDLHGRNILYADVWVNEKNRLTSRQMEELSQQMPGKTQAEYDTAGNIAAFYMKWEEVENFASTTLKDRHYRIDYQKNQILFGDGVSQRIPEMTGDTAFKVILHTCDGENGNVKAHAIHDMAVREMFLEGVDNPLKAAGGTSPEENSHLLERAKNWFSGRGRLVSEADFVQAALEFSDTIDKVRCILGQRITGEGPEHLISIVLLMKEYEQGSTAFYKIREPLKQELLSRCEISCKGPEIEIVEPVFVKVSVDVWVELEQVERAMEIQEEILAQLQVFLNPLSGPGGKGWEIGRFPTDTQVRMMLNTIRTQARIVNHVVTLSYVDDQGSHDTDLGTRKEMPFGICMNGTHRVHISSRNGRRRN